MKQRAVNDETLGEFKTFFVRKMRKIMKKNIMKKFWAGGSED